MKIDYKIIAFLRNYSCDVTKINKLLVTSFLIINNIYNFTNTLIRKNIILTDKNELQQLNKFIALFNNKFEIEELIKLFEFVISPSDKEINGAVYTPKYIREQIVKETIDRLHNIKEIEKIIFGDIACGCGGFFITIAKIIKEKTQKSYFDIFKDNIYGLDIQKYSIERTKILLSLFAISEGEDCTDFSFNLFQGNALNFNWHKIEAISQNNGFDIIVGNPPYVSASKIDNESKILINNWSVSSSGKADLYIPFFEIGLENLNNIGVLGYITVNTFMRSLNGRAIRSYFSKNKFDLFIIDFGGEQVFKNRSTYTCICIIGKNSCSRISYINTDSKSINKIEKKNIIYIPYSSLNDFDGWYLNEDSINRLILKIENTGSTLGQKFKIRNGFATLKNNIYVFKPINESDDFYFFKKDDKLIKIEKKICRNAIKPNTLKAESEINNNIVKLIFPYEQEEKRKLSYEHRQSIKIIEEPTLKDTFPFAFKYLESQKDILLMRDKGKKQYVKWYAYGRNQALNYYGYKLLFPYISDVPCFILTEDKELLFYNGYAIISDSLDELIILKKILMSNLFWFYIEHTSKPYSGNYYSLAKNYVKNFGICNLSDNEKETLKSMVNKDDINNFLKVKYNITEQENNLIQSSIKNK